MKACTAGSKRIFLSIQQFMINQVLHHTENPQNGGYPNHRLIFQEVHRVLKPKGILIINTCSQEQLNHSYWYYRLIPEAAKAFRLKFIPVDRLTTMLSNRGFIHHDNFVPLNYIFQGNDYFDTLGPLRKEWRDGDSIFALASDEELENARNKILSMQYQGARSHYRNENDRLRESLGQVTFILASRDEEIK